MDDFEKQARAFEELKATIEKGLPNASETKEKLEKINAHMDALEKSNEKLTAELSQKRIQEEETKKRLDEFEKLLSRPGVAGSSKAEKRAQRAEIKKVMTTFMRKAQEVKTPEDKELEKKYLRADNNPLGGYLCPPEWYTQILKKIIEISPIRQYSRVVQTSRESILVPVRNNLVEASWVGEGQTYPDSTSDYAQEELKVQKLAVRSIVTNEMIEDSMFDIESEIMQDIALRFAQAEGEAFILGNGVTRPEGLLATAGQSDGVQVYPSGIANSFDGDALINIAGELKVGYQPHYVLNRRTLAFVRSLKDGIGQYLWTPGLANAYPSMINGYPYINAINMPDVGADTYPVIFGDIYQGYMIGDHINMYMIRDQYTLANVGKVAFNAMRRVGGLVVMTEAIKVLKCAVS